LESTGLEETHKICRRLAVRPPLV